MDFDRYASNAHKMGAISAKSADFVLAQIEDRMARLRYLQAQLAKITDPKKKGIYQDQVVTLVADIRGLFPTCIKLFPSLAPMIMPLLGGRRTRRTRRTRRSRSRSRGKK